MGQFFRPNGDDSLWVYSERGLLSFLVHVLLRQNQGVALILENAVNAQQQTLGAVIGQVHSHRLLTEFSLGSNGFGSPDGGIFLGENGEFHSFVFVESKRRPFAEEYMEPGARQAIVQELNDYGRQAVYDHINGFNSKINGQLELRWRFVNALNATPHGAFVVSEQNSHPPADLLTNDVFYLHFQFDPNDQMPEQWRRVVMETDLRCLFDSLRSVKDFYLLAVTTDNHIPVGMNNVRLFDLLLGQPLYNAAEHLFWMPLDIVKQQMQVWRNQEWSPAG